MRGALSRSSSLFRPQLRCLQNGITQDPALQTALYSTPPSPVPSDPPTFLLTTSCWDELTIDRIDTVAAGEPRVCRLETRVSPAAVASIFLAKLHPSPLPPRSVSPSSAPRANAYVVKPFFHYEIVTA